MFKSFLSKSKPVRYTIYVSSKYDRTAPTDPNGCAQQVRSIHQKVPQDRRPMAGRPLCQGQEVPRGSRARGNVAQDVPRNKVTRTGRFEELSSPEQLQLIYTFCTHAPASIRDDMLRALEAKVSSAGQSMDMDKKRFKSKDKTQNARSVICLGKYLKLYEVRLSNLHADFMSSRDVFRRIDILYELLKAACEAQAIIEWCFGSPEISDELQRYRQKTEACPRRHYRTLRSRTTGL